MANYKVKNWAAVADQLFFPVEERPLTAGGLAIESHKAIVRTDTDQVLSVVGPDYQLVKNEDVFTELYKVLPSGKDIEVRKAWTTHDGGASFVELFMSNGLGGKIKSVGQEVGNRLIISNSYNRTRKFSLQAGLLVLACTNGMVSWKTRAELASFHLKSQDIMGKLAAVAGFLKVGSERTELYSQYGNAILHKPEDVLKRISKAMRLPDKYEQEVIKRAEPGLKNYWDLYQCFTEVITHEMDTPQRKLQFEYRLDREFESEFVAVK